MASSLPEVNLEKKFRSVTNTQDGIQTLSLWLMHHRTHHKQIVNIWLKVLKKAKIAHRLTLFYVANDVIQNSKRKSISVFKESFAEILKDATVFVREESIRDSVNRVFGIWGQRSIYSSDFIEELQSILMNFKVASSCTSELPEFRADDVISKLKLMTKMENETGVKEATLNLTKLDATNAEIVQKLKDRKNGQQFQKEFDENARLVDDILNHITKEIETRNELLLLLERSEDYYVRQRTEVKIVVHAFKNYETRIRTLQKKLDELFETFPSPLPSPCPDAPSPTNSDLDAELMLPDDSTSDDKKDKSIIEPDVSAAFPVYGSALQLMGNQIPTLTTLFPKEKSEMPSWLDTFSNKKSSKDKNASHSAAKTSDSNSLDSRLSNLLQNIPNLPANLQTTLFGTCATETTLSHSNTNSPISARKVPNTAVSFSSDTPVKDEYSGQNTPLQDEDTPLSATSTFFTQLRADNKGSQSPKDILKGLTNLIHSASTPSSTKSSSSKAKSLRDKTAGKFRNTMPPPDFTKSDSSSTYSHTTSASKTEQPATVTVAKPISKLAPPNFSFIPSIVPSSASTGANFGYTDYDPTVQNYEMDMDLDSGSNSPKEGSNISKQDTTENANRPSALITLVTESNSNQGIPATSNVVPANNMSTPVIATKNESANNWPSHAMQGQEPNKDAPDASKHEKEDVDQRIQQPIQSFSPSSMNRNKDNMDWSSKIETVQSLRTADDWHDKEWYDSDMRSTPSYQGRENYQSYSQRPTKYHNYYHQKDYPPDDFDGGNNWQDEWHERSYNDVDFRQKQQYRPFPNRRRNWRRNPQY